MRVITGTARGRRLITLEGLDVRPTTDKVKEGIFSAIQFDIDGRKILDLFAGSGQLGIEALSRGAQKCVFVDSSSKALNVINRNLQTTGLADKAEVYASDALGYLSRCRDTFDIVFLDPPYAMAENIIPKILASLIPLLSRCATIVCETDVNAALPEQAEDFTVYRTYRYGKTAVTTYKRIL
ncbi:MAG: 16S rRNA (guanine(966)-N(2))-methyltransferase RsmD [Clostridia bacterium]|nr:16S rRNA (guanine(966)-N(2))-methyltransferase RsmD [Clostridia bacterium]